jgi:hypothetical protein
MTIKPRDPLLAAAKVLVILAQIVMIFATVMLGIGLGALATVGRAEFLNQIAATGAPAATAWLIVGAMLTGVAMLCLGHRFFGELGGIIDSVGADEPFHPQNAERLSRMGWIAVIVQLLVLPVAALATWLEPYLEKVDAEISVDGGLDGGAVLLTLILFILARVFREGTRMREELEGTV